MAANFSSTRFESGNVCLQPGCYLFDGYADGSSLPLPTLSEIEVSLNQGQLFPMIRSGAKSCYWKRVDDIVPVEYLDRLPLELSWSLGAEIAPVTRFSH